MIYLKQDLHLLGHLIMNSYLRGPIKMKCMNQVNFYSFDVGNQQTK
jgi:hypothetical protein